VGIDTPLRVGSPVKSQILLLFARAGAIAAVGSALGLLVNAVHPMGLPLLLDGVPRPSVPLWVYERLGKVAPDEAHDMWEAGSATFIDTRNADDYATGHIPGSICLPHHNFSNVYPRVRTQLPKDERYLIYCYGSHCGLAMRVAKRLLRDGYQNLIVMREGIAGWEAAGYEVTPPTEADDAAGEGPEA
jgi:rhodanese-related sulfurtransferase